MTGTQGTLEWLELASPFQCIASQLLGIRRDGTLTLPLDAGYSAVEWSNKLSHVAGEGSV